MNGWRGWKRQRSEVRGQRWGETEKTEVGEQKSEAGETDIDNATPDL